jgi:hypothetical protein
MKFRVGDRVKLTYDFVTESNGNVGDVTEIVGNSYRCLWKETAKGALINPYGSVENEGNLTAFPDANQLWAEYGKAIKAWGDAVVALRVTNLKLRPVEDKIEEARKLVREAERAFAEARIEREKVRQAKVAAFDRVSELAGKIAASGGLKAPSPVPETTTLTFKCSLCGPIKRDIYELHRSPRDYHPDKLYQLGVEVK